MTQRLVITGFIIAVLLSIMVAGMVQANPLPPTLVDVHSPKNDEIYPSSTVQLVFTPINVDDKNFTSFSYVLDDQSPVATNGTATLTNLPPGQHTLTIYCSYNISLFNRTYEFLNRTCTYKDQVANVVYFTTEYSVPWITFTIIAVAIVTMVPSLLLFKRRQITSRLRGKKSGVFWLGAILMILGNLAFIPFSWQAATDYLFPYWPRGLNVLPPFWLVTIVYSVFMVVGVCMIWRGTQKSPS